jgi:hypothetical protein
MINRAALVIGQSHVAAFRDAACARRERDPAAPRTRVIHTGEPAYAPELVGDGDEARLAPPLAEAIRNQIVRHDPLVVSVTGGNVHNVLGLICHPQPFDFRLSAEPSPPLDFGVELLPEGLVSATLARMMARDLVRLRALHAAVGSFVHVESPPPICDDAFIAAAADAFFRDAGVASLGVSPAGLRYRLWRLASRLLRAEVQALGCRFLPVPDAAKDERGFLPPSLAADATHGNARYGDLLIEALQP